MSRFKSLLSHNVLILISLQSIISISGADELTLRRASVIFRHGDRTPETFQEWFPRDPNMNNSFYPDGPGSLTNVGKQRMYRFGKYLRNRYGEILGTQYDERKLFALSSGLSRTLMSLQLVLAGLYPPSLSQNKWNEHLDWQPIPPHYYKFEDDKFFTHDKSVMFENEKNRVLNLTKVQKELEPYKDFLEYVRIAVGKKTAITLEDITLLHYNLNIEKEMNLIMEPWMINLLADKRLNELRILFYKINSYTDLMKRLKGLLLRRIIEDMLEATNKTLNSPNKLTLYSGHDKNIIDILQALDVYDYKFPDYNSALIFELFSKNEEFYVKILFYHGISINLKNITIPRCTTLCPLNQFISLTKDMLITDEELKSEKKIGSYYGDNN